MTQGIHKLLIANRGEIAVRIIRAAKALGIPTVAACSEADVDSQAARMADEVHILGPARADKSYLNVEALLGALKSTGADAVHPGYGFLSENADFAEAVVSAGAIFVGPSAETIRRMGDKAEARRTAQAAGVPVVPGSPGELFDVESALKAAESVGFPLLIKASAGGGGRGIRLAENAEQLSEEFPVPSAKPKRRSAMERCTWSGLSVRPGILKCRYWATVITPCICSSANARCNGAGRKSLRRRRRQPSASSNERPSAKAPCV